MNVLSDLERFAQIVSALGPTTILGLLAFLFWRGDLISAKSLESIIKGVAAEIVRQLRDELRDEQPKKKSEW